MKYWLTGKGGDVLDKTGLHITAGAPSSRISGIFVIDVRSANRPIVVGWKLGPMVSDSPSCRQPVLTPAVAW